MVKGLESVSPSKDLLWDFELGCHALELSGQFRVEDGYYRVLPPADTVAIVTGNLNRDTLDNLLNALACHSNYTSELYQHHEAVQPSESDLKLLCDALAATGYMEKSTTGAFNWTDRFGPWHVLHDNWELLEFDPAPEAEVCRAIDLIPGHDLEALAQHSQKEFVRYFFARWSKNKWNRDEWHGVPSDSWDLPLGSGLYIHFHPNDYCRIRLNFKVLQMQIIGK